MFQVAAVAEVGQTDQMTLGIQTNTKTFDAVVGFVDLAGFTAAAETFSRSGARGTERLVQLINSLFTPAIGAIEAVGGEVGWFAGDAMGVLFDRASTTDAEAVAALAQASRLIAALPPVDVDGREVRLGAKVGVAAGPVCWSSLDGDQVTTWFGGDAIDLAVAAEHHALPGDLIVHESLKFDAGDHAAPGFTRCRAMVVADPVGVIEASQNTLGERRNLRYQPAKIARLASVGDAGSLAEHRPVTVFFASMPSSTHDSSELLEIRAAVEQQGGMISGVTEGDKGAVVMAVFGAPTAHPERGDRALHAALQIRELISGVRIGITSGRVFAGPVGSIARWDYTTIGDRVNVAARLMQAAVPGEILVDVDTIRESNRRVDVGPKRKLDLKGKSTNEIAVPLIALAPRDQSVLLGSSRTSFVGREQDVTALVAALAGDQSLVVIRGDAGSGKSRLVDHLIGLNASGRFVVTWLEQADVGRPFQLWSRLFQRLVGADRQVFEALSEERRSDPRLPVANAILGVELPETALVANLSSTARFEVLVSVVDDLLRDLIAGRNVVVEDLHWTDDQSLELLRRLVPRLYGRDLHILAASRPEERIDSMADIGLVHPLDDLVPVALRELATDRWMSAFGHVPHSNLVSALVERGAGSPLFVEQLVELAHDFGVDPSVDEWPGELVFPANLTDVVLSRLDRLPDRAGVVAKLASVLGRTFTTDDMVGSFSHSHDAPGLIAGLDLLIDAGFVVSGTPNHFHHALFAESAYERLPFGQRAEFHRDVLLHLERVHPDPKLVANDLARHAEQTDDDDRKRKYFLVAGDEARRAYVSSVALRWYNQLLELLPNEERGSVHFKLGRLQMSSGEYAAAEAQLAMALPSLSGGDLIAAQTDRAEALVRTGYSHDGFAILDVLNEQLSRDGDWANLRLVMNSIGNRSAMLEETNRLEKLEQQWFALCANPDAAPVFLPPLEGLIPLYRTRGDLVRAQQMVVELRDRAVQGGDLFRAAHWTSDAAGFAFLQRDLALMLKELECAAGLMRQVGNRSDLIAFVSLNETLIREEIGDGPGARWLAIATLEEALKINQRMVVTDLCRVIGSLDTDDRWLHRAIIYADRLGHQMALADAVSAMARLCLQRGQAESAMQLFRQVGELRPLDHGELVDQMLANSQAAGASGTDGSSKALIADLASLRNGASPHECVEIDALISELEIDPDLRKASIKSCRDAFKNFPSARIDAVFFRLTGSRLPRSEAFAKIDSTVVVASVEEMGLRIDVDLDIKNSGDAKRRGDEILANLRAAAS